MKYYYNLDLLSKHKDMFKLFSYEEIERSATIKELNCSEIEFWNNANENQEFENCMPIYESCGSELKFKEFKSKEDAVKELLNIMNMIIVDHVYNC